VEKAFGFSGMGVRNGVTAAAVVYEGFTGVWDILEGEHNVLDGLSPSPSPEEMIKDLGSHFWVTETAIKSYPVGYTIQPALGAFFALHREHGLTVDNVASVTVLRKVDGARIVNGRSMPAGNCQHMVALALIDGSVTFESTHAYERMSDPELLAVKERVSLVPSAALMDRDAPRSSKVEMVLNDGRTVEHFTLHAYGTRQNPMDTENVNKKARDLLEPVLGSTRTEEIIRRVNELEEMADVNELMPSLALTLEEMASVRYGH